MYYRSRDFSEHKKSIFNLSECFETTQSYLINLLISEEKTRIDNQVEDCANVGGTLSIYRDGGGGERFLKLTYGGKSI